MRNGPRNPFSRFPKDLLLLSGIPMVLIALFCTALFSLTGTSLIVAEIAALLLACIGAALVLRAKWPLYKERRFLTFGISTIPHPFQKSYRRGWLVFGIGCFLAALLQFAALAQS